MSLKNKIQVILSGVLISVVMFAAPLTAKSYGLERNEYVAFLRQQVNSQVMERWRGELPVTSLAEIEQYLAAFDDWARSAEEAKRHKLSDQEAGLLRGFKAKAAEIQSEAFPQLRRAFAQIDDMLFKNDVSLHTDGPASRKVVFTGSTPEIATDDLFFDDNLKKLLMRLRFDQAVYDVTAPNRSRTVTLNLESFQDGDLVMQNPDTGLYRQIN